METLGGLVQETSFSKGWARFHNSN